MYVVVTYTHYTAAWVFASKSDTCRTQNLRRWFSPNDIGAVLIHVAADENGEFSYIVVSRTGLPNFPRQAVKDEALKAALEDWRGDEYIKPQPTDHQPKKTRPSRYAQKKAFAAMTRKPLVSITPQRKLTELRGGLNKPALAV